MVETLEHLIRQAIEHPKSSRAALYKELLRSETYLLTVDDPLKSESTTRVTRADESFPIWADQDPELGGVWVPIFPARDAVAAFVTGRKLKAPEGKEFLWMGHKPRAVFGLLRGVHCFAGLTLWLDESRRVEIPWTHAQALAEGRIPSEEPEIYELPVARLVLPAGAKLATGRVRVPGSRGDQKLLCLPEAGRFRPDDLRRLVRLPMGSGFALMPCRHFLQVLRHVKGADGQDGYVEDLLCALIGFQMYGEAEALCEWISAKGAPVSAAIALAAIFSRTGRFEECADLCVDACGRYPAERAFPLHGARALRELGRADEARAMLTAAVRRFPEDRALASALAEFAPASA